MIEINELQIRPYARLLTMLGDQLIKNEKIALIELIKNSYDADADWVKISFDNFGANYEITRDSRIIIEDNGCGMTRELIEKHWLNPATPEKKNRKKTNQTTTKKGRIIQGEKGIGRFAIFKLGKDIDIITRSEGDPQEFVVSYEFSKYDNDFLEENGEEKDLFLDEIRVKLIGRDPIIITDSDFYLGSKIIKRGASGTRIEISNLKGNWTNSKVESAYRDLTKLESIFSEKDNDFKVFIYKDEELQSYQKDYLMKLKFLLEERAVIKIENGYFDSENLEYHFKLNGVDKRLSIHDHTINGLKPFRDRFGNSGSVLRTRKIECGSFSFGFYIFDFSSGASGKYKLDSSDKSILKDHRIYLYRDNIRVYPYGEPEDDWLQIDIYRGTIAAGHFLSNDQVVGYVNITQEHNPKLQDKTNREGLISEGNATEDFITVLQSLLFYLRHKPYHQYLINKKKRETQDISKKQQVEDSFKKLESAIGDNSKAKKILLDTIKDYKKEKSFLTQRAETTEDLAGIGISVETASHDIMGIMSKILANLDALISDLLSTGVINEDELLKDLQSIRGGLSFIAAQLKDIQLLFRSSKQRRKLVRVRDILDKVLRIYKFIFSKESIETVVNTTGSPLTVKTTDAVLLQLFLNLFDNAVFWLLQTENNNKKIEITLNGNNGKMIFADNGPGINEEDLPYIFEPFYSGKGEEGRGLGLYIARQLLERHDFSIEVITVESEKILHGANFVINFYNEE